MSLSDPIANMLTNIRNAVQARHETVNIPASKLNVTILNIFKEKGYVEDVRVLQDNKQGVIKVYLKYERNQAAIRGLKRMSKPGLRVYKGKTEVPRVLNGLGTAVISTSKGVVDDEEARKLNVGGELLCYIW